MVKKMVGEAAANAKVRRTVVRTLAFKRCENKADGLFHHPGKAAG